MVPESLTRKEYVSLTSILRHADNLFNPWIEVLDTVNQLKVSLSQSNKFSRDKQNVQIL